MITDDDDARTNDKAICSKLVSATLVPVQYEYDIRTRYLVLITASYALCERAIAQIARFTMLDARTRRRAGGRWKMT